MGDQEHKTFDRSASLAPQASQKGDIKGIGKSKQVNNEGGIEMKTEIKNQNESETSSKKKPTARKLEHSNSCIHDVTLEDFCKGCTDNQKSLDRKSTKKTKEEKTASLEGSMIKEITNREEEKNIKGEIQVDKVNIESTKEIISIDKSKSKESKTQTTQVLKESCKECVHDISISDFCKGCADNQKSLDRRSSKKPKENDSKNSKKVTDTEEVKLLEKKEIKNIKKEKAEVKGGKMKIIESKKDVSMTEQDEKNKTIIEEKNDHNNSNKKTDNLIGVLESKKTDVEAKSLPKKKAIEKKGPQICVHDIPIADRCNNCEENQQSLSKQSSRISETDVKIENMEVKKPLDASELKDKADVPVTVNKPVFHNLDTGVKLCIHDVLIEDFCQSCSESQVKVGHEKSSNESGGKIEVKSHDTAVGNVQQKTERKKDTTEKSETLLQSQNAPLLQSNKESKTKIDAKTNEQHQTRPIETKEKDASDVKIEIETKQEVRESDAFRKDIPKKRNNSKSRKKTQEFKPNELDELRGDFAKKQVLMETKNINTIQTVNKQADTDISQLAVKTASSNDSANKETVETPVMREQICVHDILVTEPCEKCDESQSHNTLKNYMPTKEERKKKGRKSKEIKETESMYEPVGKGNETA